MLYNLPEDIQQKIWRDVFQQSLNKLMWNGMEHIRKCGLCQEFLLKDENLLPITESYEILTEFYGLPVRSYHCKCQFHFDCLEDFYDENRDLPGTEAACKVAYLQKKKASVPRKEKTDAFV